eukprot:jgi/Chlat1/5432/Chrsp35S05321
MPRAPQRAQDPIDNCLAGVKADVAGVKTDVAEVEAHLKPVREGWDEFSGGLKRLAGKDFEDTTTHYNIERGEASWPLLSRVVLARKKSRGVQAGNAIASAMQGFANVLVRFSNADLSAQVHPWMLIVQQHTMHICKT